MKKIILFVAILLGLASTAFAYDDYGADLVVRDITYITADKKLDVQIANIGTVNVTRPFRVRVEVDGQNYYFRVNETIKANKASDFYVDISKFDITKNQILVFAEVDVDGVISEVNKTNNRYSTYTYLYPQDRYSTRSNSDRYYEDSTSNDNYYDDYYNNNNNNYDSPYFCDRSDNRYDKYQCNRYRDDRYRNDNTNTYTDGQSESIKISDFNFDESESKIKIKITNNSDYIRASNVRLRIDANGYTRYYTIDSTINRKSYIYYSVSMNDFNMSYGGSYYTRVQIIGNNNSMSKNLGISDNGSDGRYGIDLKVSDIVYDSSSERIKVKLENRGDYDCIQDFRLKIQINGFIRYYQVSQTLYKNSYQRIYFYLDDFNLYNSRYYSVNTRVDPDSNVIETNENNNTFSKSVYLYGRKN